MQVQGLFSMGILDVVDILLVAYLIYKIYKMTRGSVAVTIFWTVSALYAARVVVRALNMELISTILGQLTGIGLLALLIVFQQEIRRFLLYLGNYYKSRHSVAFSLRKLFFKPKERQVIMSESNVAEVAEGCAQMSREYTGALIAIARNDSLQDWVNSGVRVDGLVRARLLESCFFKNAPLHDGAVILRNDRLEAAQCILPVSEDPKIPKRLGLRHRAAIGLTELTDALLVVVSEETGAISLFYGAERHEGLTQQQLQHKLTELLS
ncbi:MAG: diadenylate cyclase CdaA [Bacteroides sp.]